MVKALHSAPERRCILLNTVRPAEEMIRFVMGPEDCLTPDLAGKLPGRGIWISADGPLIRNSLETGQFLKGIARSLKCKVRPDMIPEDLISLLQGLLTRRIMDRLGIEQKAGRVVSGFDKITAALGKKAIPAFLFAATDGAEDGRKKLRGKVGPDVKEIALMTRAELSQALGKENCVHALVMQGGGSDKLLTDCNRLSELRREDVQNTAK